MSLVGEGHDEREASNGDNLLEFHDPSTLSADAGRLASGDVIRFTHEIWANKTA